MNMQAMLRQAQQMQKDMLKAQEEINNTNFIGQNGLVKVTVSGDKKVKNVEIDKNFEIDDVDMVQDMIVVAINDAMSQIDKITEQKLGKYTKGVPGLF